MGKTTRLVEVIQRLIEIGRPKGHITLKDLTNVLPADQITSEQLHAILVGCMRQVFRLLTLSNGRCCSWLL